MSDDDEREIVADHRLPSTFYDPITRSTVSKPIPVFTATKDDIKRYSEMHAVCGECHHFLQVADHQVTQMLNATRALVRLVDEYDWKMHHAFPGGVENAGFCDAHGYMTQAFAVAKDCAYTPSRGKVRRQAAESELVKIYKDRATAKKKEVERDRKFRKSIAYDERVREE